MSHSEASPLFQPTATLVIRNPISGRAASRRRAQTLLAELERRGYEIAATHGPGDATSLAASALPRGKRAVVVAGGDGTINEALSALPAEVALACFPTGTVNLLARNLGLPWEVGSWLALLDEGATRAVYFARCNGGVFASVASIGFDALVARKVSTTLKSWLHEGAYAVTAALELPRYRPPELMVSIDGKEHPGMYCGVLIGKGPYFGGPHRLLPHADHAKKELAVTLLGGSRRADLLRYARGMLFGTLPRQRGVVNLSGRKVVVDARPACDLEIDGEPSGSTPAHLEVETDARTVLAYPVSQARVR